MQDVEEVNTILKQIIDKLIHYNNNCKDYKNIPDNVRQTITNCHTTIEFTKILAYLVDKSLTTLTEADSALISTPINSMPQDKQTNEYQNLQKMLQKYQAEVRQHIRQTLKLHCDELQYKIQQLQKEKSKLMSPNNIKQPIKTNREQPTQHQFISHHSQRMSKQKSKTARNSHKKQPIKRYETNQGNKQIINQQKNTLKDNRNRSKTHLQKQSVSKQQKNSINFEQLNANCNINPNIIRTTRISSIRGNNHTRNNSKNSNYGKKQHNKEIHRNIVNKIAY